ncbi:VOC family protein, partial [Methanocella conradii]
MSLSKVDPSQKLKGRNWLHFDLYTKDQRSEIRRLLKLGATLH